MKVLAFFRFALFVYSLLSLVHGDGPLSDDSTSSDKIRRLVREQWCRSGRAHVPEKPCALQNYTLKIIGLMEKMELVADYSNPV